MVKTVVLVRACDDDVEKFHRWLLMDHAPRRLAPLADSLTLQLATQSATELAAHRATIGPGGGACAYHAVIELWSHLPAGEAIAADTALATHAVLDIRASQELVAKDERRGIAIGATSGISQLSFVAPIPGMPHQETLRRWSEHIPLACQIHVGSNRYVQDRLAPGAAPWFGMAHLHFPTGAALRDGLFRTPADIETITADVAKFVSHHATMLAVEHVVKG